MIAQIVLAGLLRVLPLILKEVFMKWLAKSFELKRGGVEHNLSSMEGLRGFAVFLVFLVHYVTLIKPWIANVPSLDVFSSSIRIIGNSGVDLFFILSGYLIYGSLISRSQDFFPFLWRRIVRIYPPFVAVFIVYLFISHIFPAESKIPANLIDKTIYLAQNFLLLPGIFAIEPMITVAWSLSYEMFFYLLIPLFIALFSLRDRTVAWRVRFFFFAATIFTIYCAVYGGKIRLIMFVFGIFLYEASKNKRISIPNNLTGLIALLIGLMAPLLSLYGSGGLALTMLILATSFFVVCLTTFRNSQSWISRAFSWPPIRRLGNMSYSYYLIHGLSLKVCFFILVIVLPVTSHGIWWFWLLMPTMFSVTLVSAIALFLVVERPFSLRPNRESVLVDNKRVIVPSGLSATN